MVPAVSTRRWPSRITTWPWPLVSVRAEQAALPLRLLRLAAGLGVALVAAFTVGVILGYPSGSDLPAFLRGAELVARGESPYGSAAPIHNYLYAPWLAYLLIPATWVPFELFAPVWQAALAVALGASLLPLIRSRTLEGTLAAVLLGSFGFHAVWAGHFQPLMICLLVYALPTRWGPVAIGVAASLKITPLILAVGYAGRGEWTKVGVAVLVAAALWAPALFLGVAGYGIPVGHTLSLLGYSPVVWGVVVVVAAVAAWRLAPTHYGSLAAAVAWLALLPRVLLYDVSSLLVVRSAAHRRTVGAREDDLDAGIAVVPFRVASAPAAAVFIGRLSGTISRATSGTFADKQHGHVVPVDLTPAGVLGGAVDESSLRRQEDRIGSV